MESMHQLVFNISQAIMLSEGIGSLPVCKYKKYSTSFIRSDFHFEFVITILKNFLIPIIEFQDFEIK